MNQATYKELTARLPIKQLTTHIDIQKSKYRFPKSTSRDDIIDWIISTNFVDNYTIQLAEERDSSVDDVIQDIYLILLEKTQEEWDKLTCQGLTTIRAYISGLIYRQMKSANSTSYSKYRKFNQRRVALDDAVSIEKLNSLCND